METMENITGMRNLYKAVSFWKDESTLGMVPSSLLLLTSLQKKKKHLGKI